MGRFVFKGIPISNGIGMGDIYVLEQTSFKINRDNIEEGRIKTEIDRLEMAINSTLIEVYDLKSSFMGKLDSHEHKIFEVYKEILQDKYFIEEIEGIIKTERYYADNAVDICIRKYIQVIESSDNEYAKQRVYDINDIGTRIIKNIIGEDISMLDNIGDNRIVAVRELTPSIAVTLGRKKLAGIVAEEGAGYLAHASIILRGLGIPTINNINYANVKKFKNSFAIIDGFQGMLVVNPEDFNIKKYRELHQDNLKRQEELHQEKDKEVETTDGHKITISANVGSIEECDSALNKNVDGIGLVRTEILFINSRRMPDESEQFEAYTRIAKKMAYKPVNIRTFDIGGDKFMKCIAPRAAASMKKMRGIRQSLQNREQFISQIRSIMRASQFGKVNIMFPMVNNKKEIREVKGLMGKIIEDLRSEGMDISGNLKTGAVIESLEGVENIDEILSEVDYISIGTNDLLQETMELDRKYSIGGIREYFHPAFLKTVQYCIIKARGQEKDVSVCGEMAADPMAAIILLGMGASDLSMCPNKTLKIKSLIRRTSMREAVILAGKAVRSINMDYVKHLMSEWMNDRMG